MSKIYIAPSIFAADFYNLSLVIKKFEELKVDGIHYDIMDNHFVPNISFGPKVIEDVATRTEIPAYVHLMIELNKNPFLGLNPYLKPFVKSIVLHIENERELLNKCIGFIKKANKKVGLCIKPATPINFIEDFLDEIDLILIMSVEPGFSGKEFLAGSLKKIEMTRELVDGRNILIQVDGGINRKNYRDVLKAGANFLVIGSSFYTDDVEEWITEIRNFEAILKSA